MKIMVVNNNVMYEKEEGLFVYKETGKFFVDLLEDKNDVFVFQFRMKFEDNDFLANYNICNRGLHIVSIKRRKSKLWAYIKAFIIGFNTVKKSDFVYLFYPGNICAIFAIFSLICGKKFGFYVRGEKGILSGISKFLYKKAKVVFTISPKFTEIINGLGANAETIRPMMEILERDIIYNREYKKKLNYDLLYVGRIERDKGVYEIFEAISYLVNNGMQNFKMHIVGDGAEDHLLKEMTEKSHLSKFIIFHGMITNKEHLISFYKKADLFILPSYHEGFPRVLYEAMIFGVPIITTFVGSISYLMKDGYNSFRIEPKDEKGLSLKISDFLTDYKKHSFIAKNATKTIVNYLSDKKDKHSIKLIRYIKNKI